MVQCRWRCTIFPEPVSPSKHALLIGIDAYPKLDAGRQLRGCCNDVAAMAVLLQQCFQFKADDITLLRNEQATQLGIRTALNRLVARIGPDDIVFIHFSGHGSQVIDVHHDEASGKDNTIVPYDSGRAPQPNRDILDDELHAWLAQISAVTPYTTLLFDSCHSGSIVRDGFGDRERSLPADERPWSQLQWDDTASPLLAVPHESLPRTDRALGPSGWLVRGERYVLLAACEDAERAWEIQTSHEEGAVTHGALTYCLIQTLKEAPPGTTYRTLFERVRDLVTARNPRQHPQIEGRQDRLLFDTREVEPLRYVTVTGRNGNACTLGAGAAHGLTIGSRWSIYPQGTQSLAGNDTVPSLGTVEIAAVRAVSSEAVIRHESAPHRIQASSYAVEDAHHFGDMRLAIAIVAPHAAAGALALRKVLTTSRLLHLLPGAGPETVTEIADYCIYLLAPRPHAGEHDPAPMLGAIDRATVVVVDRNGRLAMPPHPLDQPGLPALLCDNLEKLARYRFTLALTNPKPAHLLRQQVELHLKRQLDDGSWVRLASNATDGVPSFLVDDCIAFEIVNRHSSPVYVSVLDFGLTGSISLLHPPNRPSERVEPGVSLVVGERTEDAISLWIPDEFPHDHGLETFKLFASTEPADFSWIQQGSVRAAEAWQEGTRSPLQQLFELAYSGAATRGARPPAVPATDEWTSRERTFILRRRTL